jgi:hypothetical protein
MILGFVTLVFIVYVQKHFAFIVASYLLLPFTTFSFHLKVFLGGG